MEAVSFTVKGMSGEHCENKIKKNIGALTGVENVVVSSAEQTITINHDPALISNQKLRETIKHEGYTVS